jgi:hypothetical protein
MDSTRAIWKLLCIDWSLPRDRRKHASRLIADYLTTKDAYLAPDRTTLLGRSLPRVIPQFVSRSMDACLEPDGRLAHYRRRVPRARFQLAERPTEAYIAIDCSLPRNRWIHALGRIVPHDRR